MVLFHLNFPAFSVSVLLFAILLLTGSKVTFITFILEKLMVVK